MKMQRLLSATLGLMLLAQGFAVAAAPLALAAPDAATQELAAGMPCHEAGRDPAAGADSCCDTDCTGMTSCTLGHLAIASMATYAQAPAAQAVVAAVLPSAEAVVPPTLLRPPIVSLV